MNSRVDELQAGVLRAKLPHVNDGNRRRQAIAAVYDAALESGTILRPVRRQGAGHVFHQYVVRSPERDWIQASLREARHRQRYPLPRALYISSRPSTGARIWARCNAARLSAYAATFASIPIYPELTDDQTALVSKALRELASCWTHAQMQGFARAGAGHCEG